MSEPAGARVLAARLWPVGLAATLAVLLLGPALAPGHVLTYDMVWVPDLGLGTASLGLGTALPRAVPSDAVVAVLDEIVPAVLLQKLVLLGSLVVGAPAIARLCGGPVVARALAVTLWVWNPFVVERLVLGAWPLLVGYAVLPWVLLQGRAWRDSAPGSSPRPVAWLLVLVPLGSLSASAGIVTSVALVASMLGGAGGRPAGRWRRRVAAVTVLGIAQAPWVVTGLLHVGDAVPGVPGFEVFAPSAEGFGSPLLAALSWGGAWNTEVTPLSRLDARGTAYLVLLLALVAVGAVRALGAARRARGEGSSADGAPSVPWVALVVCWVVGYAVVAVTTLATGTLEGLASVVPGLALLRDGSRLLGLCVPLGAVLAGHGAAALAQPLGVVRRGAGTHDGPRASVTSVPLVGGVAVLLAVLAPVALLPDAAGGAAGRLGAVAYPAAYAGLGDRVAALPGSADGGQGAVLVLPLATYRAPTWNDGRPVLDPVPRLVRGDVVSGGGLVVSGRVLPGEDPREQEVARLLRPGAGNAGDAAATRRALARLGIGAVVVDTSAPGGPAALRAVAPGRGSARPGPVVVALAPDRVRQVPTTWAVTAASAFGAYAGSVVAGIALLGGLLWRRQRVRGARL